MAALQATTVAVPGQPPSVEIHGDRGTATVSGSWGASRVPAAHRRRAGWTCRRNPVPTEPSVEPPRRRSPTSSPPSANTPALVDGAEARKALVVVEALYRSARTGGWVTVDPGPSV